MPPLLLSLQRQICLPKWGGDLSDTGEDLDEVHTPSQEAHEYPTWENKSSQRPLVGLKKASTPKTTNEQSPPISGRGDHVAVSDLAAS